MSYEHFAYLYDELMRDAPYEEWVRFVNEKCDKYNMTGGPRPSLLDLACGTGEVSIRLAKEGFQVTGVDLSEDMLSVAQTKAKKEGLRVPFYQQNMAELEGLGEFDIISIFCDSLNYLQFENEVTDTFAKVFRHLKNGGIFLFDVHSIYKIHQVFVNNTFAINEDDISYIWNSFPGDEPNSVEHELSFFVLDENSGKYDRYDELHLQQTFTIEQYAAWLAEAGFELLEITADFTNEPPKEDSERIFFAARRK